MIYSQTAPSRRILFLGAGRLSQHLQFYFRGLGHTVEVISARAAFSTTESIAALAGSSWDVVFLLCRDRDIARAHAFFRTRLRASVWLHCSGCLVVPGLESWHPLASFAAGNFFEPEFYAGIPFVGSPGAPALDEVVPGLTNPQCRLDDALRPRYHALCVLAGNVSALLWNHTQARFSGELGLPADVTHAFALSVTRNFVALGESGQSGPLVRGDRETLAQNLRALENDPYGTVLAAALGAHAPAAAPLSPALTLEGNLP